MKKVMIDSGHFKGNSNRGQSGYYEYEGVWKISNYLKQILELNGVQVDFTKLYEEDLNLYKRGQKAQDYDLFISEHTNAYNQKTRGVEVFYDFSKPQDKMYAEELALAVAKVMGNPSRGTKIRTYEANGITYNYYGVIRGASATNCPHIFLIESGYHDNLEDEAFLKIDSNLKKIAQAQANVILKILGIEVKKMTFDEAKKLVQDKAGIDNNSMQYLEFYKYGEDLIKKLAVPMNNNIVVKEPIIEQPVIDNSIKFSSTVNGTFQLSGRPQDLKLKVVNKSNTKITEDNCVNSTFFWQNPDGTKYATSILYAEGVTYQYNANHLPSPQSVFIIYKDGKVDMKRLHNLGQIDLSKVRLAIGGVGLLSDDPTFTYNPALDGFSGVYSDVLRKTNKTVIAYNKNEDRVYLMCRKDIAHQSALSYDLVTLVKDCGYSIALSIDGGGSSMMRANGKTQLTGDGRIIHSILQF